MSAIIWKPKYNFISPQVPFEIIIERADGSELATDVSGQLLSDIANNVSPQNGLCFKYPTTSMGFGYEYFDWNEFWTASENHSPNEWQNLGDGIGATLRTDLMPYQMNPVITENTGNFNTGIIDVPSFLDNVRWEIEDFSISATISPEFLFDLGGGNSTVTEPYFKWQEPYHSNINGMTAANFVLNSFDLLSYPNFWGQEGDTAVAWGGAGSRPSLDLPEYHNICLSFELLVVNRFGSQANLIPSPIHPADVININLELFEYFSIKILIFF